MSKKNQEMSRNVEIWIAFFLGIVVCSVFVIVFNLTGEAKYIELHAELPAELPKVICAKEVCINKTVFEVITLDYETYMTSYPLEAEIICENEDVLSVYEYLGEKIIWGYMGIGSKCTIKRQVTECKWV